MGRMLVVIDTEDKVAALQSQFDGDAEVFVVAAPPLKVSLKLSEPGQQFANGKFSFSFAPLDSSKPLLAKLRQYAGGDIYLAFAREPRGEFMSWLVAKAMEIVSPGSSPPRRLHLLALHDEELRESFRLVEPIHVDRAIGYHSRAVFDVALSKHINRLLGTRTGPAGVPLSTSCLTILLLLAEREAEVKANASRPKQRLRVKFAAGGEVFAAFLAYSFGVTDDGSLHSVEDVEGVRQLLRNVDFVVSKIEKSPSTIESPTPYRLVDLLEEAFVVHGISVGKTMIGVQRLFDGVEVDGCSTGLITNYAVVDIPTSVTVENIRGEVERQFGVEALLSDGAVAVGEGFLLPTRPDVEAKQLAGFFDEEECLIYGLIRDRALASQMRVAEGETVEVEIQAGEHCFFKAQGHDITVPGHLAVFQGLRGRNLLEPSPLVKLRDGQSLVVEQIVPEPAESELARFYTMETLFVDMADFSIEAEPVAVALLHQLVAGGYVEVLASGELRCLGNANKVASTIGRAFPTMRGINLSAYLEQTVGEVLSGRKALDVALRQFDQTMVMKGNVLHKVSVSSQLQARLRKRKPQGVIKSGPAPSRPKVANSVVSEPQPLAEEKVEVKDEPLGDMAGASEVEPVVAAEDVATSEVVASEILAETENEAQDVEVAPEDLPLVGGEGPVQEEVVDDPVPVEAESSLVDKVVGGLGENLVSAPEPVTEVVAPEVVEVFDEAPVAPLGEPSPPLPVVGENERESGIECPVCRKGRILHKKTPIGKPFYVCPREECEFMAWAEPHPLPCQVCGSPFLVEKKDLHGHLFLRCAKAGCTYRQPMPGDDGTALLAAEQEGVKKKKKVLVRRVAKGAGKGAGAKKRVLVRRRK